MLNYQKLIKEYRERIFLTQTQLADLLGVRLVTVCRWETGRFQPNLAMKKKLTNLFEEAGMKLEW